MNKRKNYFVKKRFQANFFMKFATLLLIEAILIAALFMYVSKGTLTTAYEGSELTIKRTNAYFFVSFILITLIAGTAIALSGIIVFMYLSHRIGGPLYKFERTLEEGIKGDVTQRISLRKTDLLFELKELINDFLNDLDKRISQAKADVAKSVELLKNARIEGSFDKIKNILENLKASLDHFKTSK